MRRGLDGDRLARGGSRLALDGRRRGSNARRLVPFIDVARDVARQVDEDIVHKRASLVDHAMCVLRALEALAETPEGKGVARDAQPLRAALGTKKRKRSRTAATDTPATPASEPPVLVPVRPTG